MPARSKAQQRFFGAELRRKRRGKKTRSGALLKTIKEFAETDRKGLPRRKKRRSK